MDELPVHLLVSGLGLLLGVVFGFTIRRSDFCMMGAVADVALKGDARRMRAWMLAISTAIVITQSLLLLGWMDLDSSGYLQPDIPWLGIVVGGVLFGFGMVLSCGCPSRSAANAGCGDLRALVALLVVGIFAGMTMRGLLAFPRLWMNELAAVNTEHMGLGSSAGISEVAQQLSGMGHGTTRAVVAMAIAGSLAAWCLSDGGFRRSKALWAAGLVLGLVVSVGWWVTAVAGADDFEPTRVVSLTFVRPVSDGLLYLMTFTGATIDFGVASLAGVLVGAFVAGLSQGTLRLRGFEDIEEMRRYLVGGALMGVGGVLALGCTVGQGMTGISTLSASSLLAVLCIIGGGLLGARYVEQGSLGGALRAMVFFV